MLRRAHASRRGALALAAALVLTCFAVPGEAGAAAKWLGPHDLSAPLRDAANADVAMDDAGNLVAVWQRSGSPSPIVQASVRPAGGGYASPVDLSTQATAPRVAMTPSGGAIVAYTHFVGANNVIEARVRPPGGPFGPAITVATLGSGFSVSPRVAVNAAGDAAIVWLGRAGEKRVVQVATKPAGGGFAEPVTLSDPAHDALDPQVAVGPGGEASVVWQGQSGENPNVIQHSRGEGASFTSAADVSTVESAFQPQVKIGSGGEPTIVWTALPEPDPDPLPAVIEATTGDGGGGFSPPVELSDPDHDAILPALAIDPSGGAVAAWLGSDGLDFLVQASSRAPGGAFGEPADLSASGSDADRPQVAVNAAGAAVVVWQRGSPTRIQAAARPAGGAFGSPFDISAPGQGAFLPRLAIDRAGDAVAVWLRPNGSNTIAQAAGYDADGPVFRGVSIPAQGTVGEPVGFAADPFDVWPISSTVFEFGDGSAAAGTSVSHTYLAPGAYPVTVSSTDGAGNSVAAGGTIAISPAPVSYGFRIGKRRRDRRRGTVTLAIEISGPGRVAVSGGAVKRRQGRRAAAGQVALPVLAKGRALKRLRTKGKARLPTTVTFTPDGGDRSTSRRLIVVLIKKK